MTTYQLTIYAECASKSNSRRLIYKRGKGGKKRPIFIKSQKALDLVKEIKTQVQPIDPLIEEDIYVWIKIYYPSRRNDLDPSAVFDALQGVIYANDRQIKDYRCTRATDAQAPRIELRISPMEGSCGSGSEGCLRKSTCECTGSGGVD